MSIIAIVFIIVLGGLAYTSDSPPLYHKATFILSHECKQVQADDEVCVDLTSGKTALYAPKEVAN